VKKPYICGMNAINTEGIAEGLARCFIYEANRWIEKAAAGKWDRYNSVFRAFLNLGCVKAILGDRFEEVRQELHKKAEESIECTFCSESWVSDAAGSGLKYGGRFQLPKKMGEYSIHPGLVAGIVSLEFDNKLRYFEGSGWYVWRHDEGEWEERPKGRGIVGLIYEVMRLKIAVWREAIDAGIDVRGLAEWIEELESKINDPAWLDRVEELLRRVDYFGVEWISEDSTYRPRGKNRRRS
jgi:hypothetical protein